MSEYSASELLAIVAKWSTPSKLEQLKKEGVNKFYDDIKMKQSVGVSSLTPFMRQKLTPAFDPAKVKIDDFKVFIDGVARLVVAQDMKLNSLLAVKKFIRAHLYSKDESDPYVMAWKAAKLSVQPEEFVEKRADQERKVSEKNKNVLTLSKTKVDEFYNSFLDKKNPDLVDKIITLQATLGLRMIEVLSSKVSEFRKNGEHVEQVGTAKMVGTAEKIVSKTPIFIDSGKFMEIVGDVRKTTDKLLNLTNAEIVGKYNSKVNERIVTYLKKVKIDHSELRSSHGLRRLYVAVAYMLLDDDKLTYHQFIKESLGHESGGSVAHYNTIVTIGKDEEETKEESKETKETKVETKETKEETKETKEAIRVASLSKATRVKYEVFKKAVAAGKTSYEQLERVKIPGTIPQKYLTRNMISKFKKM